MRRPISLPTVLDVARANDTRVGVLYTTLILVSRHARLVRLARRRDRLGELVDPPIDLLQLPPLVLALDPGEGELAHKVRPGIANVGYREQRVQRRGREDALRGLVGARQDRSGQLEGPVGDHRLVLFGLRIDGREEFIVNRREGGGGRRWQGAREEIREGIEVGTVRQDGLMLKEIPDLHDGLARLACLAIGMDGATRADVGYQLHLDLLQDEVLRHDCYLEIAAHQSAGRLVRGAIRDERGRLESEIYTTASASVVELKNEGRKKKV